MVKIRVDWDFENILVEEDNKDYSSYLYKVQEFIPDQEFYDHIALLLLQEIADSLAEFGVLVLEGCDISGCRFTFTFFSEAEISKEQLFSSLCSLLYNLETTSIALQDVESIYMGEYGEYKAVSTLEIYGNFFPYEEDIDGQ